VCNSALTGNVLDFKIMGLFDIRVLLSKAIRNFTISQGSNVTPYFFFVRSKLSTALGSMKSQEKNRAGLQFSL